MANDFLPFSTSGTANVYTNAEYVADTDHTNGNQPGIAKSKLVNKALRQCSIISTVVAQFISDITGTNSVDDGTTATLLADLKLATKGRIGAPVASATTTTVGGDAAGDVIHITGTTTIASLGVSTTGVKRSLIFDGILTLTHNATSLILPGAANITTSSGSVGTFVCIDGALGYWKCIGYTDDVTSKAALKTYFDTLYPSISNNPAFRATGSSQAFTANTTTKLVCGTEQLDNTSAYDAVTNYRFTPSKAGWYDAHVQMQSASGNYGASIHLYKNGSNYERLQSTVINTITDTLSGNTMVYLNGTTDYIEAYGSWTSNNNATSIFSAHFIAGV